MPTIYTSEQAFRRLWSCANHSPFLPPLKHQEKWLETYPGEILFTEEDLKSESWNDVILILCI